MLDRQGQIKDSGDSCQVLGCIHVVSPKMRFALKLVDRTVRHCILSRAGNRSFLNIRRSVQIVAMWRRPCVCLALLQSDPVALRNIVRRQHRHLCSHHIQGQLMLIESQDKGLNAHDLAVSRMEILCHAPAQRRAESSAGSD